VIEPEETLFARVVEQRHDRRVEARDVQEPDGLVVDAKLRPREDFKELIKRAQAAGERDEGIRERSHHHLAFVHGVDDVDRGEALVGKFLVDQEARDDARCTAAVTRRTEPATAPISPVPPPP
jgi:hypothetical protein